MANSMERTFRRSVIMNLTNFKFEIEFNEFICRNLFIFFFSMRRQVIFIEEGNFFLRFPSRDTARLASAGSLYFRNGLSIFLEL